MYNEILNITNGDYFNDYFISKYGGVAIPFCEAMMDGEVVENIYSEEFVAIRAKSLNVTEDEYRAKMYVCDSLNDKNYQIIHLWFGKDTFCQMNLLTLLAYLEQIEYSSLMREVQDVRTEINTSNLFMFHPQYQKMYDAIMQSDKG